MTTMPTKNSEPTKSLDGKTIRLRDGRLLGYAEYGVPEGKPVLHFNGFPGTRFEASLIADAAARVGVRLIGVDRPGMGLSDFQPGRRILDWPDDVLELADALGLERFAVMGVSGGGPFCALRSPAAAFGLVELEVRAMRQGAPGEDRISCLLTSGYEDSHPFHARLRPKSATQGVNSL